MDGSDARGRLADTEAGTSIVEAMVATLLVAVGVLAVVSSLGAADRAASVGDRRSSAVRLAASELETVRSRPYDQVGIAAGSDGYQPRFEGRSTVTGPVNAVDAIGRATVGGTSFDIRRHVTWQPIDAGGTRVAEGFKLVTILVTWTDSVGDHTVRQDTGIYAAGTGP